MAEPLLQIKMAMPLSTTPKNHWSERGWATSVGNSDVLGRRRRSVLALADFAHSMRLPTAKDISPQYGTAYEGNDERCARQQFHGKSLDEAEALFRKNALYYEEDLLWMGATAFRYYVPAFIRYIQSEHSSRDPDAINCFASLLEQRAEKVREVAPIAGLLADACRYVLQHYDKFEADPSIYGDLRPRYESLVSRLHELHVG